MKATKVSLNINDNEAFVTLDYPDGSTKKWSEELDAEDYVAIVTAGIIMQKGTIAHCVLANSDRTNKKIAKMERLFDQARQIAKELTTKTNINL